MWRITEQGNSDQAILSKDSQKVYTIKDLIDQDSGQVNKGIEVIEVIHLSDSRIINKNLLKK